MWIRKSIPAARVLGAGAVVGLILLQPPTARGQRQLETLGRGLVAVRISSSEIYVGWRMLGTDPDEIGFNLYRSSNGGAAVKLTGAPLTVTTDFVDTPPHLTVPNSYFVRPVLDGIERDPTPSFTVPANTPVPTDHQNNPAPYLSIPLQLPPGGTTPDGGSYTYSANDCSIGDLDGDGEYEIVVKWDPSNSQDNAHDGYTGNVLLDGYHMDGTLRWRIDLGINIRAGAHYTQFMVYDLDGDGRAEIACRTAPGTVDGAGADVILPGDNPAADYRNSDGRILTGPEYLTVFDGLTGAARATVDYLPARGNVSSWGDGYGNRVDRFLACVAYLDGVRPSLVMCRGYYTRTVLAAWDWHDDDLKPRWVFDSNRPGNGGYAGQGNHNLSVGDVDGDGKDEIVYGGCSIDDDGKGLYTTGLGHGDALHVSDMDPDRPGLEVWDVHESPSDAGGGEFRDARTGELIYGLAGSGDTGRGLAAHIDERSTGYQMWSSASGGVFDRTGREISGNTPSINFAVWWDADLQRELLDNAGGGGANSSVNTWTGNGTTRILSPYSVSPGARSNNSTKSNPCLSGDLLGDWREEMMFRSADSSRLMLFVSPHPATNRFRTFLHDAQYRQALAWQNVAYNQPPHPSFYVGAGMPAPPLPQISDADRIWGGDGLNNTWDVDTTVNWRSNGAGNEVAPATFQSGHHVLFDLSGTNEPPITLLHALAPSSVTVHSPIDYTFAGAGSLTGPMTLRKAGTGTLILETQNSYTGPTLITEGVILVNGSLDQSPVTVTRGVWHSSAIGGTGILGGGVTAEAGCAVVPGNGPQSPGTLTISNQLVETGGVINGFDLSADPSGPSNDLIRIAGGLSFSGVNTIRIDPFQGSLAEGIYPLFHYTGTLTGDLTNVQVSPIPGYSFTLVQSPGEILVQVGIVPIARPLTFVDAGARWRFHDIARDPGRGWTKLGFSDATWPSGPPELGFGDGDETTLVTNHGQWTTYFRHAFSVPAASRVQTLVARLKRDDGAVVYLNGMEVWRSNMPEGETIVYATPAASTVGNDAERAWHTKAIPTDALVDGWNLLAVEVHQVGLSSSDITFDLELSGTAYPFTPPILSFQMEADHGILSWPGDVTGFTLYESTQLAPSANWQVVPATPSLSNGQWSVPVSLLGEPTRHFRLQSP